MKIPPIAAMVTVGFLPLSFPATAATIHVPDEQPTIQAGIDAASIGDTVLVACGTYYEHDIVLKPGVCLSSETGLAECVTIDAQGLGRALFCLDIGDAASIVGFTITGGLAVGSAPDNYGGGMMCWSYSSPTLTNCTFSGNQADYGGGMYCYFSSSPTLTGCTFSGNQADYRGGGMHCFSSSSPTLTGCTFSGNQADYRGGGMHCYSSSSPTLTGCTFSGNQADCGGGMSYLFSSFPTLTNCIIAFSTQGEAVYCSPSSGATLTCCDVYGNAGGDWVGCIADQYGINGNISEDPLFCHDDNPEEPYSLHTGSPCLPENNPCGELVGAFGQGCGPVTPVEGASWGAIKGMFR